MHVLDAKYAVDSQAKAETELLQTKEYKITRYIRCHRATFLLITRRVCLPLFALVRLHVSSHLSPFPPPRSSQTQHYIYHRYAKRERCPGYANQHTRSNLSTRRPSCARRPRQTRSTLSTARMRPPRSTRGFRRRSLRSSWRSALG